MANKQGRTGTPTILRMEDLEAKLKMKKSQIREAIRTGRFPKGFPILPGGRALGWLEATVDTYLLRRAGEDGGADDSGDGGEE